MERSLKIYAYYTLLGVYAEAVVDSKEADKTKKYYRNSKKIYDRCNKLKPLFMKSFNPIDVIYLRNKITKVQDLEEKYFADGYWNSYSLVVMCLEMLVNELEYKAFEDLLKLVDGDKIRTLLETDENYKELNKVSNRYFVEIRNIIGD